MPLRLHSVDWVIGFEMLYRLEEIDDAAAQTMRNENRRVALSLPSAAQEQGTVGAVGCSSRAARAAMVRA